MNNYITKLNTKIIKRKNINNKIHIVTKNHILLNYKKYNIDPEQIYVNNEIPIEIYSSTLGEVFVISKSPNTDNIQIKVDSTYRLNILKSLTSQVLINSVLNKYFSLKPNNFYTGKEFSSFTIDGIYFDKEANLIKKYLENNINTYINYGIKINHNIEKNQTYIKSLYYDFYIPYTVSNLSEIKQFSIIKYEINNLGIKFYYNIK